jgi:hypothetical protein
MGPDVSKRLKYLKQCNAFIYLIKDAAYVNKMAFPGIMPYL